MTRKPFFLLSVIYFLSRLFNLLSLPIFNDESIYLHWGNIMTKTAGLSFYSMIDGKPPLILWNYGLFQQLPIDPLIAGRLVSVIFGFITLLGLVEVGKLLGLSKRGQVMAGLLYIFNPLLLFFDRMALLDGPVSTVYIWILYLSLKISLNIKESILNTLLLGLVQGIGLWIKSTVKIFIFLPLIIPAITFLISRDSKKAIVEFKSFIFSFLIAQVIFLPIRLNPYFQTFSKRESDFLLSFDKIIDPFNWSTNLIYYLTTLVIFISPIILALSFKGGKMLRSLSQKNFVIILSFLLIPVIGEIVTAVYFRNRYFIFTFLPMILLAAIGLESFKSRVYIILTTGLLIPFTISILLALNPFFTFKTLSATKALSEDLGQYYLGWTSGFGVKDAAYYLSELSQKEKIIVIVRADSGNPEDAMFVYLGNNKNIILASATRKPTKEDLRPLGDLPIYFVTRGAQYLDMKQSLKEIIIFNKPLGDEFVGIYQLEKDKI